MKKRYSKAFICEAIAYWKKQLKKLNESSSNVGYVTTDNYEIPLKKDSSGYFITPKTSDQVMDVLSTFGTGSYVIDSERASDDCDAESPREALNDFATKLSRFGGGEEDVAYIKGIGMFGKVYKFGFYFDYDLEDSNTGDIDPIEVFCDCSIYL